MSFTIYEAPTYYVQIFLEFRILTTLMALLQVSNLVSQIDPPLWILYVDGSLTDYLLIKKDLRFDCTQLLFVCAQ